MLESENHPFVKRKPPHTLTEFHATCARAGVGVAFALAVAVCSAVFRAARRVSCKVSRIQQVLSINHHGESDIYIYNICRYNLYIYSA